MALKPLSTEIKGHRYEGSTMPARKGLRMQARLASIVGPSIAGLVSAVGPDLKQNILDADISADMLQAGIRELVSRLDENTVEDIVLKMFEGFFRDSRELTPHEIDGAFAGNYSEMVEALRWIVEQNGFFGLGTTGGTQAFINQENRPKTNRKSGPEN